MQFFALSSSTLGLKRYHSTKDVAGLRALLQQRYRDLQSGWPDSVTCDHALFMVR